MQLLNIVNMVLEKSVNLIFTSGQEPWYLQYKEGRAGLYYCFVLMQNCLFWA